MSAEATSRQFSVVMSIGWPPSAYDRTSKITRRKGWSPGATTARLSETSGPFSHKSARVDGRFATHVRPDMTKLTATAGVATPVTRWTAGAAAIGKLPAAGMFAVTTAKRIEPSGHRTLT